MGVLNYVSCLYMMKCFMSSSLCIKASKWAEEELAATWIEWLGEEPLLIQPFH